MEYIKVGNDNQVFIGDGSQCSKIIKGDGVFDSFSIALSNNHLQKGLWGQVLDYTVR